MASAPLSLCGVIVAEPQPEVFALAFFCLRPPNKPVLKLLLGYTGPLLSSGWWHFQSSCLRVRIGVCECMFDILNAEKDGKAKCKMKDKEYDQKFDPEDPRITLVLCVFSGISN